MAISLRVFLWAFVGFEVSKVWALSLTSIVLSGRRRHFFVLLKTHPMFLRLLYLMFLVRHRIIRPVKSTPKK